MSLVNNEEGEGEREIDRSLTLAWLYGQHVSEDHWRCWTPLHHLDDSQGSGEEGDGDDGEGDGGGDSDADDDNSHRDDDEEDGRW
jgi:hypothetical protein